MNKPRVTVLAAPHLPVRTVKVQNPNQIWTQLTADQRQHVLQVLSRACRVLATQAIETEGRDER